MCFLILSSKTLCEIVQAAMLGNIIQPSQPQCSEGLYKGLIDNSQTGVALCLSFQEELTRTFFQFGQSINHFRPLERQLGKIRKEISEHTCFSLIFLSLANFFSSGVSLNALSFLVCSSDPMF